MRTIKPTKLAAISSYDLAAARAWKLPAGVSFALDGGPVVEGHVIRARRMVEQSVLIPA